MSCVGCTAVYPTLERLLFTLLCLLRTYAEQIYAVLGCDSLPALHETGRCARFTNNQYMQQSRLARDFHA